MRCDGGKSWTPIHSCGYRAQTNNRTRHAGSAVALNPLSEGVASLQWCGPDLQARPWTSSSSNVALAGRRDNRLARFSTEMHSPIRLRGYSPSAWRVTSGQRAVSKLWVANSASASRSMPKATQPVCMTAPDLLRRFHAVPK
jgi:hypothetical protein